MGVSANDVVSLTRARANLSDLAEQANAGAEKIITKHGESYVALIGAARLEYYHHLERERMHLLLLDDATHSTHPHRVESSELDERKPEKFSTQRAGRPESSEPRCRNSLKSHALRVQDSENFDSNP